MPGSVPRPFRRIFRLLLAVISIAVAVLLWWGLRPDESLADEAVLSSAQRELQQQRPEQALELLAPLVEREDVPVEALKLAGEAALQLQDFSAAIQYLSRIKLDGSPQAIEHKLRAGELAFVHGYASRAESILREVVAKEPSQVSAQGMLAYLLMLEGRDFEARPHLEEPFLRGYTPLEHLFFLETDKQMTNPEMLERIALAEPDNAIPDIARAKSLIETQELAAADELLQRVVQAEPQQMEAWVQLGEIARQASEERFSQWLKRCPRHVERHPGFWRVRGDWFAQHQQHREAIACFREAVFRDPNDRKAVHGLGQQLNLVDESELASVCLTRSAQLEKLAYAVDEIRRQQSDLGNRETIDLMKRASQLCEVLERPYEALAWLINAGQHVPERGWEAESRQRLAAVVSTEPPFAAAAIPEVESRLSRYPLPARELDSSAGTNSLASDGSQPAISFRDDARSAGLDFVYFNGADPDDDRVYLVETTGGGVAVLDYDADGWPDFYFTQGTHWPLGDTREDRPDKLFRNRGDGTVRDVTVFAGIENLQFGQGVTAGDFDNDGFDDLYIANIGTNLLYRNNGDGTFSPVSLGPQATTSHWTTSCLLADVNGDSFPDIYDVNYVSNDDLDRAVCQVGNEISGCGIGLFKAAQDRLLLNTGDGQFQDVTTQSGIVARDGSGLGIVAVDLQGHGQLSLFIANDGFPNFLFQPQSVVDGVPVYQEQAIISGLALDRAGRSQACMGVAAGDADGDGRIDLFVTNFYQEPNTLYLQRDGSVFEDATESAGLHVPSYHKLGFGTQFIDADLDGWRDLIATNGHVFDLKDSEIPYAMTPQFFRNSGAGRFQELPATTLGEFFRNSYLGRGMARLDWNRDGREDLVISQMNAPAALLTNSTQSAGNFFGVSLRGSTANRNGIGATVSLRIGNRTQVQQLTAGDGYQACNQRLLLFGLGEAQIIDEIAVHWPNGREQQWTDVAANQHVSLVEGDARLYPIRP